ncbi:MAG: hypothetical protein OES25_12020 [Acidobacteriota bacterium]|nr:hypothetical protein [Acidobacteriota bacterium]
MSLARLARRRTWRMLPIWALATGVNTSVLLGLLAFRAASQEKTISTLMLIWVCWVGVATYLVFADARTRCSHFEMSLPVRARQLWANHLGSLLVGGFVNIGLALLVVAAHRLLLLRVNSDVSYWSLCVVLVTGVVLATLLLQLPRPTLARIPVNVGTVAWAIVVLCGTPWLLGLAATAGPAAVAGLAVVVAILAIVIYRAVPPTYSLIPLEAQSPEKVGATSLSPSTRTSRLLVPLTIARCVSAGAKELAAVPIIFLGGVILGGGLLAFGAGERELRFLYIPMAIYMMFAVIGPRLASLHYLDPLPISRRPLIAMLVVPYFLIVCLGYGCGAFLAAERRSQLEYVNFEEGESGYQVTIPLRTYGFSRDGTVQPVVSPWGESHTPELLTPLKWSSVAVYSPFGTSNTSSTRFVALQISRAARAVYTAEITPETIEQRYLTTNADGDVIPRGDGLTLRQDFPDLRAASGPMLPVLVTLVTVPWLLLVALLLRAYRPGVREWVRQTIVWGGLAGLLAFWIWTSMTTLFGVMRPWAMRALVEIPMLRLGQSALGSFGVWVAAFGMLAAAYWIAQAQFRRMEITTHPSQYTLIRMGSD